ncbi:MAG: hypothetical protein ABGX26_06440 [Nautiliaceae bacterium]
MGLIITPEYLNEGTLLVIPITTKSPSYENKLAKGYKNIFYLQKEKTLFY